MQLILVDECIQMFIIKMYTALQKGMSIVLIIRFDTLEKILNFYYNPYIKNMTIDDSLHPFLQSSVLSVYLNDDFWS